MATPATFDDVWKMFQESIREHDRRMQEGTLAHNRRMQEYEQRMQESKAEHDRILKNLARQMGGLADKWGQFVEGLVAPSCKTLFAERGIPVHRVFSRAKAELDDGRTMEIDLLVDNTTATVLVEVKSTLTVGYVRDHLKRLKQFKTFFPSYADKKILGAVAGIVTTEKAEQFARNQGLFVIVQAGETVRLANEKEFIPRVW